MLYNRLSLIPYQNSVPSILTHLDDADRTLMTSYETAAGNMLAVIKADEATISSLNQVVARNTLAFEHYTRSIHETGIVVDARNTGSIAVFISPSQSVKDGDQALVFGADSEYVATLQLSISKTGPSARLVDIAPNKTIEPFDGFLIKKQVEK